MRNEDHNLLRPERFSFKSIFNKHLSAIG